MANLSIIPNPSPIYTNTSTTFSTHPGYYSYSWSGDPVNVTGNTYQSNPVTFTNEGLQYVNVEVCAGPDGCCQTFRELFYVYGEQTDCDFSVTGSIINADVTHIIPSGLTSDVYIWFRIGGWPDKLKVTRNDTNAVLINTTFIGKTVVTDAKINDPDISGNSWYRNHALNNLSIGCPINSLSTTLYDDCSNTTTAGNVSPYLASGVDAVRSNNYSGTPGGSAIEVGVYIKIPQSAHGGSAMTVVGSPFQIYTCEPYSATNAASFIISCQPITAAGDFGGC